MMAVISAPAVSPLSIGFGTSFIHSQNAFTQERSIQRSNRRLPFACSRHLDKGEAARLACIAVLDDGYRFDRAVRGEQVSQLLLGGLEIDVVDENIDHNLILLTSARMPHGK